MEIRGGKNECSLLPDGRTVEMWLTRGFSCLLDVRDLPKVQGYKWCALRASNNLWYAYTDGILMHKLLCPCEPGEEVDHIDGNTLDNRRHNLRSVTRSQNSANRKAPKNNTSGYKGVSRVRTGKWTAYIKKDYHRHHLGTFDTPEEAARAYNRAARQFFGEHALLNEVEEA